LLVRTEFPFRVRVIRHEWIPMPDGCRLAARIWLPENAEREPVPAVLEYLPYRKNDGLALRDAPIHHYFAGHGYASVRVDMRGTGDADGILEDEYLPLEQEDGVAVIRWLAAQPWCTGKVGIIGKSWGGFNGLQIAAHRPPGLAAVISVASTDDRYADDGTRSGGRARCARTTRRSTAPCTWWAGGPTPTATRSCGSWPATPGHARA
jgi:putative CocE/NonD family hydrolase